MPQAENAIPAPPRKLSPLEKLAAQSKQSIIQHQASQGAGGPAPAAQEPNQAARRVHVDLIDPNPWQPRTRFDDAALQELAQSIQATQGVIEPIVLRQAGERYQLVVGERRWRAARLAGHTHIDAVIRTVEDGESARMALVENIDREDLSDYEIGLALGGIREQFDGTTALARYLGKDRKDTYRYLAFLELPPWLRARLDRNPRLIHRVSAESLKSLFAGVDNGAEPYQEAAQRALDLVESGALTQSMLIPQIRRFAAGSERLPPSEVAFHRHGQKVGSLMRGGKHIRITLKAASLTEAQTDELERVIHRLVKGEPSAASDPC